MKAIIAGFIVIALSGAAVLWHRCSQQTGLNAPAVERTTHCMVWKAQRGMATVWLCGSFHLLRKSDYPLPQPYLTAFNQARRVVMELPPGETMQPFRTGGRLPAGKTLNDIVSAQTWDELENWNRRRGERASGMMHMKPWFAAVTIAATIHRRLGFDASFGMERWFTARLGDRLRSGLETAKQQLAVFDSIDPPLQEQMILQAIEEYEDSASPASVKAMMDAWRNGEVNPVYNMMQKTMGKFPELKKRVLDDRTAAWLPAIEKYLDGTETVMVLVGTGHLAGPGSLIDLLEKKGVSLTQMEYRTTRAAE